MFSDREHKFKRSEHMFMGAEHKNSQTKERKIISTKKEDKPY